MCLSCLTHENELPNNCKQVNIYAFLYHLKNAFLQLILNLQFLSCLHQLNSFHSESEIIFANDEHRILRGLSFIFALFDLLEKYVN